MRLCPNDHGSRQHGAEPGDVHLNEMTPAGRRAVIPDVVDQLLDSNGPTAGECKNREHRALAASAELGCAGHLERPEDSDVHAVTMPPASVWSQL